MPRSLPKNVAAAVGLVPTVLGGVRRLPVKAVQLPVMAVGSALAGIDAARREYDDLADRGERLIARLRGSALADDVAQVAAAPTMPEKLRTAAQMTSATGPDLAASARTNAAQAVRDDSALAHDRVEATAALAAVDAGRGRRPDPGPAGEPTDSPAAGPATVQETLPVDAGFEPVRHDTAAPAAVVERVDEIAANLHPPSISDHSELPLPDYDHMTLGALRGRLRSLDMTQLVQLRDYEKSKADRLPVVTMLDNRIARLANGSATTKGSPEASSRVPASKPPKKVTAAAPATPPSTPAHQKVRTT